MNPTERAKNILLLPAQEWSIIDKEPGNAVELFRSYIAPLAAIGPVASIIGLSVFGVSVTVVGNYRLPFANAIGHAVTTYVFALIGTYVLALIIDALAPTFLGTKNNFQALKVAAYSSTAAWLAGIFNLLPSLALLHILGLYSLYLLYLGLPILMKAPREKALSYTIVVVIAAIVIVGVIGALGSCFLTRPLP